MLKFVYLGRIRAKLSRDGDAKLKGLSAFNCERQPVAGAGMDSTKS